MDTTITSKAARKHGTLPDPLEFAETYFPTPLIADDVVEAYNWAEYMDNAPVAPPASLPMLLALQATGKHVYAGTVAPAVKAKRRAAGKAAKAARKANR